MDITDQHIYISNGVTFSHPNNLTYNFAVTLPKILDIDETWQVTLTNIVYWNPYVKKTDVAFRFFVESDIVQPSIVNDTLRRVISSVPVLTDAYKRIVYEPKKYQYVNLANLSGIHTLNFYIKDEDGKLLTSLEDDITLSLHFKRNI